MGEEETHTTVLVVDDKPPIRETARRIVDAKGYQVIEAGNGLEATGLLSHGGRLDLLILGE